MCVFLCVFLHSVLRIAPLSPLYMAHWCWKPRPPQHAAPNALSIWHRERIVPRDCFPAPEVQHVCSVYDELGPTKQCHNQRLITSLTDPDDLGSLAQLDKVNDSVERTVVSEFLSTHLVLVCPLRQRVPKMDAACDRWGFGWDWSRSCTWRDDSAF